MRVLAVGAHPDDLELLCAGTLARFAAEGHEVVMCHTALGDAGSFVHTSAEITAIRREEAQRAASTAGARWATLGLSDGAVNAADPKQRRAMTDLIREHRPDLLITHSPNDYMPDHNEVSKLVFDTSFLATVPLIGTDRPHHDQVTPLYYMETVAGLGFSPEEYVDISSTIDTKTAMFECHASQVEWLRDHDGVDTVDLLRTSARFRGHQCGVPYAEGFVPARAWLRGTARRLLP